MRIGVRTVIATAIVVLGVMALGACSSGSGGASVQSFCSTVRKNSDALNRPAVGVGVDNQTIMETHVAAVQLIKKQAPTDIKPQVSYIADKTKAFLEQWRADGFKTIKMPEFDTGLDTRYKDLDSFVSNRCSVTLTN